MSFANLLSTFSPPSLSEFCLIISFIFLDIGVFFTFSALWSSGFSNFLLSLRICDRPT